jgi:hypothetical protein
VDKRPRPGDLILNHYDQQRSGEAVYACEARREIERFLESDIKEEMADSQNTRGRIRPTEVAIENKPLVFVSKCITACLSNVRYSPLRRPPTRARAAQTPFSRKVTPIQ